MLSERRTGYTKGIASTLMVAIFLLTAAFGPVHAQTRHRTPPDTAPANIRQAIATTRFEPATSRKQRGPAPPALQGQLRPATRGMLVALGATAGAVALGSALAASEEGDNGMRGLMVGLPIGAALGGILTWRLTR